ncbi:dihydroneopterin aldolase [Parvibium lacunae]|uniref:dihydroneopterin aldolase n=1 Tax=Parvibium lacunae TaxID=1888893 RepID=A0A368KZQ7_9BURK|nr:dihydroneopterin aldolase [Parvibium lacunae]RCS56788.1 dihydroneopterin aldolase [Parvibium lacunae]
MKFDFHELMLTCRRVSIQGLRLDAFVGVFDEEKERSQPIIIDIAAYADLAQTTPQRDALDEVFDYNQLRNIAHKTVDGRHIHLLETLTDQMAAQILQLPSIRAVHIIIRKPTTFADCEAVCVELFKMNSESA